MMVAVVDGDVLVGHHGVAKDDADAVPRGIHHRVQSDAVSDGAILVGCDLAARTDVRRVVVERRHGEHVHCWRNAHGPLGGLAAEVEFKRRKPVNVLLRDAVDAGECVEPAMLVAQSGDGVVSAAEAFVAAHQVLDLRKDFFRHEQQRRPGVHDSVLDVGRQLELVLAEAHAVLSQGDRVERLWRRVVHLDPVDGELLFTHRLVDGAKCEHAATVPLEADRKHVV
mmetsp:Transcript_12476/g.33665  ORF Transcript_12476/g.33665 Transcript_12476/m.33665 type:complete len:225 (+) Transcript_12476:1170-1844(+)